MNYQIMILPGVLIFFSGILIVLHTTEVMKRIEWLPRFLERLTYCLCGMAVMEGIDKSSILSSLVLLVYVLFAAEILSVVKRFPTVLRRLRSR